MRLLSGVEVILKDGPTQGDVHSDKVVGAIMPFKLPGLQKPKCSGCGRKHARGVPCFGMKKAFNPEEKRDQSGKWSTTDGSAPSSNSLAAHTSGPSAPGAIGHDWEKTKPWTISRGKLMGNDTKDGIHYDPSMYNEARNQRTLNGKIHVGKKFFDLPEGTRRAVLYHELGHDVSDEMLANGKSDELQAAGHLPGGEHAAYTHINGQTVPSEVLAEGYGTLMTDEPWLKDHFPGIHDAVLAQATQMGYPVPGTEPGTKENPIHTTDVNEAAKLLGEGKHVELAQPRMVSTLLDKLKRLTDDAVAKGDKAPIYNLCGVSVKGSNLFCAQSKGVPRVEMPQLTGKAVPGSEADKMPRDKRDNVDVSTAFRTHLEKDLGVKVTDEHEGASYLKASQDELNGAKVALLFNARRGGYYDEIPIFVSKDNYIIDGHHRWASAVADGYGEDQTDIVMPVMRVDMGITQLLEEADKFTEAIGIEHRSVTKSAGLSCLPVILLEGMAAGPYLTMAKFNPDEDRDNHGRFTAMLNHIGSQHGGVGKLRLQHREHSPKAKVSKHGSAKEMEALHEAAHKQWGNKINHEHREMLGVLSLMSVLKADVSDEKRDEHDKWTVTGGDGPLKSRESKALGRELTEQGHPSDAPIRSVVGHVGSHTAVARGEDGKIAGAIAWTDTGKEGDPIFGRDLRAVVQKKGVGAALMKRMAQDAHQKGKTLFFGNAVTSATKYYEGMGGVVPDASKPMEMTFDNDAVGKLASDEADDRPVKGVLGEWEDAGSQTDEPFDPRLAGFPEGPQRDAMAAALTRVESDDQWDPAIAIGLHLPQGPVAAYLKEHGKRYEGSPLPAGYERGTVHECYSNATHLVQMARWTSKEPLRYCEGFVREKGDGMGMSFLHGWALDADDKVIDNTIDDPENHEYWGVTYDTKDYLRHVMDTQYYGVLGGDEDDAMKVIAAGGIKKSDDDD